MANPKKPAPKRYTQDEVDQFVRDAIDQRNRAAASQDAILKADIHRRVADSAGGRLWELSDKMHEEAQKLALNYLAQGYAADDLPSCVEVQERGAQIIANLAQQVMGRKRATFIKTA